MRFGADSYRDVVGSSLRQGPVSPFSIGLRDNLDIDYLLRQRPSFGGWTPFGMLAALRRWIEIEITRWCNGNTRVFGTRIPGSSPGRVDVGILDCIL